MKAFKDFGIITELPSFTGDKIKVSRIVNRQIIVHDFRIEDSKYGKENSKYLCMQISLDNTRHVVFTSAVALMQTISKIPKPEFPFTTTIIKENERYEFS